MKTISRRICGALLGLCFLGSIGLVVRADDWVAEMRRQQDEECRRKAQEDREAQDRAYQQAQAEQAARDRAYYEAQAEQAARDRAYQEDQQQREAQARADYQAQQQREAQDKEYAEREARDKYWRDVQAERDAQAASYKAQEDERQRWEEKQRWQEWEKWMYGGSADWSSAGSNSGAAQVRLPGLVILNPFALDKMAPKDQERVRQQATQAGQRIMPEQQIVQNPFVRAAK